MHFQVALHQDGWIRWDFAELGFSLFGYDLYSGVYPNGGTEIGMIDGSLADVTTPSAFEFNPVTRAIGPPAYSWFNPSPVLYDSGETADLLSHLVPETAGLEDGMAYHWGVRYQGDNGEWSPWSAPTLLVADALPPTVILKEPGHLETGVAINTVIRATFSEPIVADSLDATSFTLNGPAGALAGTVGYAAGVASFTPDRYLSPNATYTATLGTSVTDTVGKPLPAPESWVFTTGGQADAEPPRVEGTTPDRNAMDVPIDIGSITVTFSEPMDPTTIHESSFRLTDPQGTVDGIWSYDVASRTAHIDPDTWLAHATTYTVSLTQAIQDSAGNALAPDSWMFRTVEAPPPPPLPDRVRPRVVSSTPTNLVPASLPAITVTFSEAIQTINTTSFTVSGPGGPIPGTVQYDPAGLTAWFSPDTDLDFQTHYAIEVSAALIRDLAGNMMRSNFVGGFQTLGDPVEAGCDPDGGNEEGCVSFDDFTYGAGAFVGLQGPPHTGFTAEEAARRSVLQGDPDEEAREFNTTTEMEGMAQVDATRFRLTARSESLVGTGGIMGAAANGAAKIEVRGAPPGATIPMRLVISSSESGYGGALLLRVTDFDRFQTLATMESHAIGPRVLHLQMIDPYGSHTEENFLRTTNVNLTAGFGFDFLYPAIPNNGIHVNLAVHAKSQTAGNEIQVTVALEVDPPPGVTVTLASGQVFSGELDTDGDGVSDLEEEGALEAVKAAIATPPTPTGTGNVTVDVSSTSGVTLSQVKVLDDDDLSLPQDSKPTDRHFPDGLVSFQINGLEPGATTTVELTFPTPFPDALYYKVDELGFYEFPGAEFVDDRTVRLTLTDGGSGDADGMANGVIVDPGGIAVPLAVVPTLSIVAAGPGSATLTWEPPSSGYVLQETPSIPPTGWVNSTSGTNNPVLIPTTGAMKFYRVAQP
jgi:hypothetical protein